MKSHYRKSFNLLHPMLCASYFASHISYLCLLWSAICFKIRAVFSHVYLQSFTIYVRFCATYTCVLLALCGFYSQVYDHFFTNAHIYAHKKAQIYALQTSICGKWGQRKSSYKTHRIIPSAKNSFMYNGAEK